MKMALTVSAITLAAAVALQAQLITGNNAASGGGPIQTNDFGAGGALVGSFVPTGAGDFNNGRGVEVVGDKVYYTELSGLCCATDFIRIAPFNGGAGGADIGSLPNPRPGAGIQDLVFSGGVLYALTGYNFLPLEVVGLNPITGAVVSGPVSVSPPGGGGFPGTSADGFTVLPNGNFLVNDGDLQCTYRQYPPDGWSADRRLRDYGTGPPPHRRIARGWTPTGRSSTSKSTSTATPRRQWTGLSSRMCP